jgi:hypothetical protein
MVGEKRQFQNYHFQAFISSSNVICKLERSSHGHRKEKFLTGVMKEPVAHACHLSYSGGRDQEN